MSKPKTTGVTWLKHSMGAFNGSGYADKSSPEAYARSYVMYKAWRKERNAVAIAITHPKTLKSVSKKMMKAQDAGRTPSDKHLKKFKRFCDENAII